MASQRRAVHIDGIVHGSKRPAGSRIGNIVVSATLSGRSAPGMMPSDPAEQMHEPFLTMIRFLQAAGAGADDVIRVNMAVAKAEYRELLNAERATYFNDEENLRTRKAAIAATAGDEVAELDLMAVISKMTRVLSVSRSRTTWAAREASGQPRSVARPSGRHPP